MVARLSVPQLIIDCALLAFLILSFAFFGGGGSSAAVFIWGVATLGNIVGFSTIIQWIANHTRREAVTLFWVGLILKTCVWLSPELINIDLVWSSLLALKAFAQSLLCWDSLWAFIESFIHSCALGLLAWLPDLTLSVWPWDQQPVSPD